MQTWGRFQAFGGQEGDTCQVMTGTCLIVEDKAKSGVKPRVHAMLPRQALFLFDIILAGGCLPSIPLPLFLQQWQCMTLHDCGLEAQH